MSVWICTKFGSSKRSAALRRHASSRRCHLWPASSPPARLRRAPCPRRRRAATQQPAGPGSRPARAMPASTWCSTAHSLHLALRRGWARVRRQPGPGQALLSNYARILPRRVARGAPASQTAEQLGRRRHDSASHALSACVLHRGKRGACGRADPPRRALPVKRHATPRRRSRAPHSARTCATPAGAQTI